MSVLPTIEEEFVSTGQAKVEVRPIAILGEESELAAQAAECANDQGRFWDFHDVLYANQDRERSGAHSTEKLERFAEALNLDTAAFDSCLESGTYAAAVREATASAREQGVSSTPTLLVDGREVSGDGLRAAIQEELTSDS